ncbi:MAG: class I SAM-dependent methyltransferase [Selenomonadaceae bacterium]|nr:class I SAM-dependent methyltransferase [Selenomonadaceae bacterium]
MASYKSIVNHYEECLEKYGDNHKGVDWPNQKDALLRYKVMLDVIREDAATILDFGCGAGHLYQYILDNKKPIDYIGLDISPKFIELCEKKYTEGKVHFVCIDVLRQELNLNRNIDYAIMNGVFTEKVDMTFEDMEKYFHSVLLKVFPLVEKGIAFNVMSKFVDWERDDLFHMPTDRLLGFVIKNLSRNFVVRNDYGLYEYTVYVYK